MKHNKLLILPLLAFLLGGCANNQEQNPPVKDDDIVDTGDGDDPIVPPSPPAYVKDELETPIPLGGLLPIGNKVTTGPDNLSSPVDISSEKTFSLYSSMPSNFTFIMGNNKVDSGADFYSETAGGGLKLRKEYYGFQSCAFTGYKYVDISFKISSVNNSNGTIKDEDTFHLYGYDSECNCIVQKNVEKGTITTQSKGTYINISIHNDEMMYFELRMNALPFKGQQNYNVGISEVKIKGSNQQ